MNALSSMWNASRNGWKKREPRRHQLGIQSLSLLVGLASYAGGLLAQNALFTPSNDLFPSSIVLPGSEFAPEKYTGVNLLPPDRPKPRPDWMKNLTIESFGYDLKSQVPGFQFSPGYTASFYNLEGLECPMCVLGPRNTTRFTLPPFGVNGVLKLRDGRVELFGRAGGVEAWKADGTYEPQGLRKFSNAADGDAWLTQVEGGGRVAIDHGRRFWLGASSRYLYNFGPGLKQRTTLSGQATFRLGH
jgi:hypothetical protein